jgi:hypothetical protein
MHSAATPTQAVPKYIEVLTRVHRHIRPRTYVEIGVALGRSFACVLPGTLAVGIDPKLAMHQPVNRSAKFFALTSDEFFEKHDLRAILNGEPVDLAFIDGMHQFEFALRDFINLEKFCTSESTILVHDCYPLDEASTTRTYKPGCWTGDIWKIIPCLKNYRPELQIAVVPVTTGLGIVRGLNAKSTVLSQHYEEICREFVPLAYDALAEGKDEKLNKVPYEWDVVQRLLPSRPYRAA